MQCALPVASGNYSAGGKYACRNPCLTPQPFPNGEGENCGTMKKTIVSNVTKLMEADQVNAISNSLSDLTNRTVELRRYL